VQVQQAFGDRIGRELFLLSVTLDPGTDTPRVLKDYAELYGAGPGWTFLTGDEDQITELRHRLGAFDPDPVVDADKTQHASILVFGNDPKGRWCGLPGEMRTTSLLRLIERVMSM